MALRTALPFAFALLAVLALCSGCEGGLTPGDKEEDQEARIDYYKSAAQTYYDGGRYEASARMWEKVLGETPDDPWAKFGLAKSLQMSGSVQNLRRAEAVLQGLTNLSWVHPTRGDVRFEVLTTLANTYSDLADYYDRDVRILDRRLRAGAGADSRTLQEQLERQTAMRNDLLRKSIPLYREVLNGSPENAYALAGLAKSNLLAGDESAGIAYAQRYVELSRRSQTNWRRELRSYEELRRSQGQEVTPQQRTEYVRKIQGARGKEMGMHLLLGSVHMRREEFSRAVAEYDAILSLDPSAAPALVERAQAYAALALYAPAIRDLETYLKLTDPEKERQARVAAAALLDRYRRINGDGPLGAPPPVAGPRALPPAAPPPVAPRPDAFGSPDG